MPALLQKDFQFLELREKNTVLTVTLDRADKKNALSFKLIEELITVAKMLKKDRYFRAVILAGNGDIFCSGIDLQDLGDPKNRKMAIWELIKPTQSLFQQVCLIWRDLPIPVISVLHGYCLGAGLQLALATDIRIATPECQLAIMEAKWGLVPDMGLTQSALHLIPVDVLKELAMTARIVNAKEAQQLGLVTHVDSDVMTRAETLAAELISRSPDAVLANKRVINAMTQQRHAVLYREKIWQLKLLMGKNRVLAIKKAKDSGVTFLKRQFR